MIEVAKTYHKFQCIIFQVRIAWKARRKEHAALFVSDGPLPVYSVEGFFFFSINQNRKSKSKNQKKHVNVLLES